jgi:hypothetical protein
MSAPSQPNSPTNPGRNVPGKPLGVIALVTDERLSRERSSMLFRVVAILSTFAKVEIISGALSEEEVLKQIEVKRCGLVLAPWYHYLQWTRIEAFYGLSRMSGPTFAGYHAEPLTPAEISEASLAIRGILVDLGPTASKTEIQRVVRALLVDKWRSGLRPLLDPQTPIYTDNWTNGHTLGKVLDYCFAMPELQGTDWIRRGSSIRLAVMGLWNLVFPDGQATGLPSSTVRAHFMAGVDRNALCFRLCYSIPTCTPKTALNLFWPKGEHEVSAQGFTAARELIARSCDMLRAHTIAGTQDIEVTIAFFTRTEAEPRLVGNIHHLWIEPISGDTVLEIPERATDGVHPFPRPTNAGAETAPTPAASDSHSGAELQDAKDRFIVEATQKVRKLQQVLEDREMLLRELRSGGVGVSAPLPPPDADSLIDALWERILECEHRLFLFQDELADLRGPVGQHDLAVDPRRLALVAAVEQELALLRLAVDQHLGRPRARVVVRAHGEPVGASREHAEQVAALERATSAAELRDAFGKVNG